ncbi:LLM class flavin-dependent oxidoreductase [Candidatus Poriferisodalis sp.]|uniref:LLM class flavin-dependent oxidoreductase n=1 Tax=Candidatus Poriferisodalis sp. TaxID=3101277 RepID=UPI003D1425E5
MRFSIFYEHQLPRPWDEGAEARVVHEALEQVQLADRLGFNTVWEVEHHFLEEYSHSSAPEVFLAACAATTQNIHIGHGIVPVLPGYNHPARVAERISTLDIISNGRVEFGTGETSSDMELLGFELERADKRSMWEEAVPEIAKMMSQAPYEGHTGKFFSMPARNVVPKPVQRPHPPIWVACSQRDTILMAGSRGIGALSFAFINPEEAKQWVADYYAAFEACTDPVGLAPNPNIAVTTGFMCHEDEQTALDRGLDGFHFFAYSLLHYYQFGTHTPGRTDIWTEFEQNRAEMGFEKLNAQVDEARADDGTGIEEGGLDSLRGCIGTPDQIRDFVRAYEDVGVDELIFVSQAGRNRHEDICESMELFAREVMPEFAERAPEREARKRERYAETIERLQNFHNIDLAPRLELAVPANPSV